MRSCFLLIVVFALLCSCSNDVNEFKPTDPEPVVPQELTDVSSFKLLEPTLAYLDITGVDALPTGKTDDLHAYVEYRDEIGNHFKKRVILNAQGASSLNYPKKNLAMDFCEDEWVGDNTTSIQFGDWVTQDAFHFKANWIDTFRGGLAVATAYKFYDDIIRDDEPLYERAGLKDYNTKALYHPDGFPCIISLNGQFQGLYAWQLKKHRKNMNMEKDNPKHVWFQLETYTSSFDTGEMNWNHIEIKNPKKVGDESRAYIQTFANYNNELKALEESSNGQAMREAISARYDITSMVNMIIHGVVTSNIDGFGKNANFFTYDGKKWFVMPYDLDETFGNSWIASFQFPAEWSYLFTDYSLLDTRRKQPFNWISRYFWQDIKDKYRQLRDNGTISTENIIKYLTDWNTRVGQENYSREYTKWSECPSSKMSIISEQWEFIEDWTDYSSDDIDDFSYSHEYKKGDLCRYDYRLWRAKDDVKGVEPAVQKGYFDTEERVREWLDRRISFSDIYFEYHES